MIFDKERRLTECLDYLKNVDTIYDTRQFSRQTLLQEYLICVDVTPRQTGATTTIAKLFDVKNDLYITHNYGTCTQFKNCLINLDKLKGFNSNINYIYLNHLMTKEETLLSELSTYLNIKIPKNSKLDLPNSIRGKSIQGLAWFDLGQYGLYHQRNVIYNMIDQLYDIYPTMKFIIT